ncbi:MetQ/NlpA family ABC transporter substrate-binding protein [Brachyspira pulli]|uniref:MetQ/NlpA family ABC transporter substrate-binding protein n=1 Tax=Brachyspira pulli TaxID=310721 RepID=UPI003006F57F
MKNILMILLILLLLSCSTNNKNTNKVIEIGYIGEFDVNVWESMYTEFRNENIILNLDPFSDYSMLNEALERGDIDLNTFQHYLYFVNETNKNNYDFTIIDKTYIASMDIYSQKLTNINQMPTKAKIAIPDDNINLSRALKILASINLIKLASNGDINYSYTLNDIEENKLNLEIVPTKVEQIRYMMYKFTAAIINYNFASDLKDCNIIYHYDPSKYSSDMYVNLIVTRSKDDNLDIYKRIAKNYKNKLKEFVEAGKIEGLIVVD